MTEDTHAWAKARLMFKAIAGSKLPIVVQLRVRLSLLLRLHLVVRLFVDSLVFTLVGSDKLETIVCCRVPTLRLGVIALQTCTVTNYEQTI